MSKPTTGKPTTDKTTTDKDEMDCDEPGSTRLFSRRTEVLRFICRHVSDPDVAEDLTQETMLRGLRNYHRLRHPRALRGWLLRIAHHVAMDWHRGRQRRDRMASELSFECQGDEPCAEQQGEARTLRAHWNRSLFTALGCLRQRERVLIIAHYFVGLSCKEIAGRSGLTVANVKVVLHRARLRLRRLMPSDEEFLRWRWARSLEAPARIRRHRSTPGSNLSRERAARGA